MIKNLTVPNDEEEADWDYPDPNRKYTFINRKQAAVVQRFAKSADYVFESFEDFRTQVLMVCITFVYFSTFCFY